MKNQEEATDIQVITMADDMQSQNAKSVDIIFSDLFYKVGNRVILNGISGICKHNEVSAILGSSGAGKTSLLNLLCQRINNSLSINISGKIMANGKSYNSDTFSNFAAYVMQDDVLPETLTVRECLQFAANLRLKGNIDDKKKRVDEVIQMLKLERCADTFIGGFLIKGVSGGERKRTSIGFEMVMDPGVLFLDEPTSGLDSFTAFILIHQLKELAQQYNKTVIFTIHQPSSDIWNIFNRIFLLVEGKLIYQGPGGKSIIEYFNQSDIRCKSLCNPADFFMSKMHNLDSDNVENFPHLFAMYDKNLASVIQTEINQQLTNDLPVNTTKNSFIFEVGEISKRTFKIYTRNPMLMQFRFVGSIFMGLFAGAIYFDLPDDKDDQYSQRIVWDRNGALFFIIMNTLMEALAPVILTFPQERAIFLREENSKMYTTTSYYIGRSLVEQPFCVVFPTIFMTICYWMIGFNDSKVESVVLSYLIIILIGFVGNGIGIMGGSAFKDVKVATGILPVLVMPFMLFGGFFQNRSTYVYWAAWLEYISPFKYAFEALARIQYEGSTFIPDPIVTLDFNFGLWNCIFVLIALYIGFHTLALTFLYLLRSKMQ